MTEVNFYTSLTLLLFFIMFSKASEETAIKVYNANFEVKL